MSGTGLGAIGEDERDDEALEAWSTYREVSERMHSDVVKAVDAYSHYNSMRTHSMGVTPQTAIKVKRYILRVCKRLLYELKMSRSKPGLEEIHERWAGEGGYVARLERASLHEERLDFLGEMVSDLVEAAWRLGYLESGRMAPQYDDPERESEAEVAKMFE